MKNKRKSEFPAETEAVLRSSRNLKPCKAEYGRMPYNEFLEHIRCDRCAQCLALVLQLDKEKRMMSYLREDKN